MKKKIKSLKNVDITKRKEFVLITLVLTALLLAIQVAPGHYRFWLASAILLVSLVCSYIGLREDIAGIKKLTLVILPAMYTAAITLGYFLLPVRWITRLPTAVIFALGMYAILLVENIYSVAATRSIQLLRVAHAVGFLLTLFTLFLLTATIFSLRLPAFFNGVLVFAVHTPLAFQSLWSYDLNTKFNKTVLLISVIISLLVSQSAFVMSYWPLKPIIASLFITSSSYALVGISQQHLVKRLFKNTIVEFVRVFVVVLLLLLLTTKYR